MLKHAHARIVACMRSRARPGIPDVLQASNSRNVSIRDWTDRASPVLQGRAIA
jgi:hypothetical protein